MTTMAIALKEFNASVKRNVESMTRDDGDKFVRWMAFAALRGVIMKTPVDTGRLRGNWQVGINTPQRDELDAKDKLGGATMGKGFSRLTKLPPFPVVWISNNLPYAEAIEEGHSKVKSPQGMVAVTIEELTRLL